MRPLFRAISSKNNHKCDQPSISTYMRDELNQFNNLWTNPSTNRPIIRYEQIKFSRIAKAVIEIACINEISAAGNITDF